ncbi:two-component response regulator ORR24-like [Cucumis melo]|uniref:Two-component response regulator ORR24-like n=1 Tax=Cucumis melo TaxID=3656 RepID=A0A1S3BGE1_CUCME|nr:two-component response regulator ORR24-like [Cucumis melo]
MSLEMDMKTAGRAIAEWGCYFLEKPISMEDIELVWQIVYRKVRNPRAKSLGENTKLGKRSEIDGMLGRIVNVTREVEWKPLEEEEKGGNGGKCRDQGEEKLNPLVKVEEKTNRNERTNKKSRIVWNSKLHRKFTEALSKLGNRKSSPKIILKMMDEPSLTLRQVASHLQKFKSQVKHLNKITANDSSSSTSFVKNQLQQLPPKRNTNILTQQISYITDHNLRHSQVPAASCLNNPPTQLPNSQDVFSPHLIMMNQNNSSNSYRTTQYRTTNNDLQLKTYGGLFEEMNLNLVEGNHVFTDELYTNESTLEGFIQTSHYSSSNFQHFPADEDYYCSFFQDDHGQLEFAQNLAGSCLDVDNNIITSMSGAHSAVIAGRSMNQNVALKELDDLLNNTEEDPMVYCCYDGEMNSFDIDQYSEWLNA